MAHRADHVLEHLRHDHTRHRCRRVEPCEISGGVENLRRLREVEIEEPGLPRYRLVPPPEQESRYGDALLKVLVLERLLELGLAARRDVVEDRENARKCVGHVRCPVLSSSRAYAGPLSPPNGRPGAEESLLRSGAAGLGLADRNVEVDHLLARSQLL